jgi:hypothetical protein
MFKAFIIDLCNCNSRISLAKLIANEPHVKLNWTTVRLYHQLHGTGK